MPYWLENFQQAKNVIKVVSFTEKLNEKEIWERDVVITDGESTHELRII
jgi:protein tyrosine phosphatase